MTSPRILLMPTLCSIEWKIKPLLEDWADVASFDAPGVEGEAPKQATADAVLDRALARVAELGWSSFVVVGDEVGAAQAIRLAGRDPDAVEAIALGHAALSLSSEGARAPLNGEVADALVQVARTDFRSYVRALSQASQHNYDEKFAQGYMERVPPEVVEAYLPELLGPVAREDLEPILRGLEVPMLLVEHKGCLMWTHAGFEDIVAAFPQAATAALDEKPSVSPEFAELLREFCESL